MICLVLAIYIIVGIVYLVWGVCYCLFGIGISYLVWGLQYRVCIWYEVIYMECLISGICYVILGSVRYVVYGMVCLMEYLYCSWYYVFCKGCVVLFI